MGEGAALTTWVDSDRRPVAFARGLFIGPHLRPIPFIHAPAALWFALLRAAGSRFTDARCTDEGQKNSAIGSSSLDDVLLCKVEVARIDAGGCFNHKLSSEEMAKARVERVVAGGEG